MQTDCIRNHLQGVLPNATQLFVNSLIDLEQSTPILRSGGKRSLKQEINRQEVGFFFFYTQNTIPPFSE
ncbi:MAG: hypothetical protein ACI4SX_07840, partial [Candidatus Fimenecus sp.]